MRAHRLIAALVRATASQKEMLHNYAMKIPKRLEPLVEDGVIDEVIR
mgnify:CR=1 FL=1